MEVDYTGAGNVARIIQATKLSRFIILRIGSTRHATPVFEYVTGNTPDQAVTAFNNWAAIAENSNTYEMVLFKGNADDLDLPEAKKKEKAVRFTFCISKGNSQFNGYNQQQQQPVQPASDIATLIENVSLKLEKKYEERETQRRYDELQQRIKDLEDDDDELEEVSGSNDLMSNITQLMGAFNKKNNPSAMATINGLTDDQKKTQKENIVKAINILAAYNPQIDTDLLKLASIAEKNTSMFNTLLGTLRSM